MSKKKRSKHFSDAFTEVLKEYAGNAGYGSAYAPSNISTSPLSYGQRGKGQNPPYSVFTDVGGRYNDGTGVVTQGKDETDAPKIAPYPLQTVTDGLVNAYEQLVNVKGQIDLSTGNPSLTPAQQKELENLDGKLEKLLNDVKTFGDEILKIKLKQD